jgi:phage/plasmid-like protein (TIGR03299 family)
MAFVGELPWHGLGTYCGDEAISAKDMLIRAGLDWSVVKRPLFVRLPSIDNTPGPVVAVPDQFALCRTGEHAAPLSVVGRVYTEVQNSDLFDVLDMLAAEGAKLHTAGSLWGGRQVWAMAQLPVGFEVRRRDGRTDAHAAFVHVRTWHGGGSIELAPNETRIVCANTLALASHEGFESVRIRHTAGAADKLAASARILAGLPAAMQAQGEVMADLAAAPMSASDAVLFVRTVIAGLTADNRTEAIDALRVHEDKIGTGRSRTILDNQTAEVLRLFEGGKGNDGDSRYDALNALTEWIDHKRTVSRNAADKQAAASRAMESATEGTGAGRKQRALRLLTRW